jgi:hypothetical protein
MVGSALAAQSADAREMREIADKPDKVYRQVKDSGLPDKRMFTGGPPVDDELSHPVIAAVQPSFVQPRPSKTVVFEMIPRLPRFHTHGGCCRRFGLARDQAAVAGT